MVSFDVAQYRRLDPTIRKIKPALGCLGSGTLPRLPGSFPRPRGAGFFRQEGFFDRSSIRMLDLRWREFHRARISMPGQPVDHRSAGIAQSDQLRNLVESLSRGIVASVPDVLVAPALGALLRQVKMRVSAGNHQRQQRKSQLAIPLLFFLEQYGVNVPFQMIDRNQRLLEGEGQSLRIADADEQRAR